MDAQSNPQLAQGLKIVIRKSADPNAVRGVRSIQTALQMLRVDFPKLEVTTIQIDPAARDLQLLASYEQARAQGQGVYYLVDDYCLHDPFSISEMLDGYARASLRTGVDTVICPIDDPSLYDQHYASALLLGRNRYWRNVGRTSAQHLVSSAVLDQHWQNFLAYCRVGVDPRLTIENTLSQVFAQTPAFTPLPSLVVDLSESGRVSPYVDFESWGIAP